MASMMPSDSGEDSVRNPDACYTDRLVNDDSFYIPPECPDGISASEWQDILNQSMFEEDERKYAEQTAQNLANMLNDVNATMKKEEAIQREHARRLRHDEIRRRMITFSAILKSLSRARQYEKDNSKDVLSSLIAAIEVYVSDDKVTDVRMSSEDYQSFLELLDNTSLKKQLNECDKQTLLDTIAIEVDDSCDEYRYDGTDS